MERLSLVGVLFYLALWRAICTFNMTFFIQLQSSKQRTGGDKTTNLFRVPDHELNARLVDYKEQERKKAEMSDNPTIRRQWGLPPRRWEFTTGLHE